MSSVEPDSSELTSVLRELGWIIHRRAPERAGVGPIPTTELALLKQVLETPGATVGELAQTLGLRQPNVSAAITVLTHRGLVVKTSSAQDRRVTRIMPTDLGESEHQAIAAAWVRPLTEALSSLEPRHLQALEDAAEALEALHAALQSTEPIGMADRI